MDRQATSASSAVGEHAVGDAFGFVLVVKIIVDQDFVDGVTSNLICSRSWAIGRANATGRKSQELTNRAAAQRVMGRRFALFADA